MSSKGRCVVLADLTDSVAGRGRRCRSACNLPRPDRSGNTTSHPHGWADRSARSWLRRHRIPRRNRPGTITERFPTAAARHGSLSAGGISGYRAGNHTHRAAHRPTDGTHPEPDAHTRYLFAPKFLAMVGPPTTTDQDPKPGSKSAGQTLIRRR